MKNQFDILIVSIIAGLIILNFIIYGIYSTAVTSKTTLKQITYQRLGNSLQNFVSINSYALYPEINMSIGYLLTYYSLTGNSTLCEGNTCIDIPDAITNFLNEMYGNRWNLTIYIFPGGLTGWIVKMFLVTGVVGNWNPCQFNPPPDNKGRMWYEFNYNDSFFIKTKNGAGWIKATAPFHERMSCEEALWGLENLYYPASCDNDAIEEGVCIPLNELFPNSEFTNASVFCPNGIWNPWPNIEYLPSQPVPTSTLPKTFIGYEIISGTLYPITYDTQLPEYYAGAPAYQTATDITTLALDLGLISPQQIETTPVGSFYRGKVYIPPECQQVFLDIVWHEVVRLYLAYVNKEGKPDYVFLTADPVCNTCPQGSGAIGDGKTCPLYSLYGRNTNAEGIYRINITYWAIIDRDPNVPYIILANAYWDPHPKSNGVSIIRVYCITSFNQTLELNYVFSPYTSSNTVSLGYPIPSGKSVLTFNFYYPTQGAASTMFLVATLRIW